VIELRDISVRFRGDGRDVEAVRKVSLRVQAGEVFGIVGSSGAGKSTLVRTINLLERPGEGTVHVGGVDVTRHQGEALRAMRRGIGMVFQHFNLLHARTVFDNVAFPLRVGGEPGEVIARRVPELLGLVGLEDKARAYPAQLSGGQKQRVGIARALANRPGILLCDEPTSALDLETTAATLALLDDLHRKLGFTMVVITHEMEVVKALCDRVAVMARGEIVEQGAVYDVFATPRHELTRQLVARTQGLSLPARLLDGSRGRVVKVLFRGAAAEEPVVAETARRFDVRLNILHGRIEYIGGGHPIGVLVVGVDGAPDAVEQALAFMRERTAGIEELHG
jgi:D-methionine transport system ATP-binding protein